jgi:hypothetical protein
MQRGATKGDGTPRCLEGTCPYPIPQLDHLGKAALSLIVACETQWEYHAMSGVRIGIPRERLVIEADIRGIELFDLLLDKVVVCERFLISQDVKRSESQRNG